MEFDTYNFNKDELDNSLYDKLWPYVYVLYDSINSKCYVGETVNIKNRLYQHLDKKDFKKILTITNQEFNKSFTLDVESNLIELLMCDNTYLLENRNSGIRHDFFQKTKSEYFVELIWKKLIQIGIAKNDLDILKNNLFYQLNPLKPLTSAQEEIVNQILLDIKDNNRNNYIIQGQAGTGKTLCANVLFHALCGEDFSSLKIGYTSGNSQLRIDLKNTLKNYSRYFNGKNIMSPSELVKAYKMDNKKYDFIIVDEAQRLKGRNALTNFGAFDETSRSLNLDFKTTNELDWIKEISNNQIIIFDEYQSVKNSDIDIIKNLKNTNYKKYLLSDEMRLANGDEYLCLLKNILFGKNYQINKSRLKSYDFQIFDSFSEMYEEINKLNKKFSRSYLLSGLGFPKVNFNNTKNWNSSKNRILENFDFEIENIGLFWNVSTINWIDSKMKTDYRGNINEVGCIHVIQGQTLNYAGVIISKEIDFVDGKIVVNKELYNDSIMKQKYNEEKFLGWLLNIYYVLLTRGVKGTYIYIANENLRKYIKSKLKEYI